MKKIFPAIFYLSYYLFIFSYMFSNVKYISNFTNHIRIFSLFLILFNILIQSDTYKLKTFLNIIFLVTISIISYYFCNDNSIILLILFIIGAKNIKIKEFIKKDFVIKILFTIIIVILYYCGLTNNYIMFRSDGTIRESMGFAHPNIFGSFIFSICCDYIFIFKNNKNILKYIFVLFLIVTIIMFSDSRTTIITILFLLITDSYFNMHNKYVFTNPIIKTIIKNIILIGLVLTIIAVKLYDNQNIIGIFINENTSERLKWASRFMNEYQYNLLGHNFKIVGTYNSAKFGQNQWVLDNAYIYIILKFGIIIFILFYYYFRLLLEKLLEKNNITLILILLSFCIYGFMETGLFRLQYNSFLIVFTYLLYDSFGEKEV